MLKKMIISLLLIIIAALPIRLFAVTEAMQSQSDFLEYYSLNKDVLDPKAPFSNSIENFAEYHDALLQVIEAFEKERTYETAFPVEGKITSVQNFLQDNHRIYATMADGPLKCLPVSVWLPGKMLMMMT